MENRNIYQSDQCKTSINNVLSALFSVHMLPGVHILLAILKFYTKMCYKL